MFFPQYEIANEIACIVWAYHTSFFAAYPCLSTRVTMFYSLFLFRLLQGYSVRWLAIQEPICRRLNEIISSQSPVLIYHRWCDEILPCYQIIDRCARVFQYHLEIALVAYLCELIQYLVEIGSLMQSLYCVYASFRHTHLSLVHRAKRKIHLLRTLEVDAREESQNKVIILPPPLWYQIHSACPRRHSLSPQRGLSDGRFLRSGFGCRSPPPRSPSS